MEDRAHRHNHLRRSTPPTSRKDMNSTPPMKVVASMIEEDRRPPPLEHHCSTTQHAYVRARRTLGERRPYPPREKPSFLACTQFRLRTPPHVQHPNVTESTSPNAEAALQNNADSEAVHVSTLPSASCLRHERKRRPSNGALALHESHAEHRYVAVQRATIAVGRTPSQAH